MCPENISDDDDQHSLGLGELLDEHRVQYFIDKLSGNNNFSHISNDLEDSQ